MVRSRRATKLIAPSAAEEGPDEVSGVGAGASKVRVPAGEFPLFPQSSSATDDSYRWRDADFTPHALVLAKYIEGRFYRYQDPQNDQTPFDPWEFTLEDLRDQFGVGKFRVELFSDAHNPLGAPTRIWRRTVTIDDGEADLPFPCRYNPDDGEGGEGGYDAGTPPPVVLAPAPSPAGIPGWDPAWGPPPWLQAREQPKSILPEILGVVAPALTGWLQLQQQREDARAERERREAEDCRAEREAERKREAEREEDRRAERRREAAEFEERMAAMRAARAAPGQDPMLVQVMAELATLRAQAQAAPRGTPLAGSLSEISGIMNFVDSIRGPAMAGGGGGDDGGGAPASGIMGTLTNMVGALAERLGPEYVAKIVTAAAGAMGGGAPPGLPAPQAPPALGGGP